MQYPVLRICLGIPYYISITIILHELSQLRGPIWITGYIMALILSLGLSPLLELRYFVPGTIILLLNIDWKDESNCHSESCIQFNNTVKIGKDEQIHNLKKSSLSTTATASTTHTTATSNNNNNNTMILISIIGLFLSVIACTVALYILLFIYTKKTFIWSDNTIARFML